MRFDQNSSVLRFGDAGFDALESGYDPGKVRFDFGGALFEFFVGKAGSWKVVFPVFPVA